MTKFRLCGCGCGKKVRVGTHGRLYLNNSHRNRAAQRRLRQRAKQFYEYRADYFGSIGVP